MCGILSNRVKLAVSENGEGCIRKNEWRMRLKNNHTKKVIDRGGVDKDPRITHLRQKTVKINSSILIHSKSRKNRSATGEIRIREESFLLLLCLLLLKLETITGRAAPSCVRSSLTSSACSVHVQP